MARERGGKSGEPSGGDSAPSNARRRARRPPRERTSSEGPSERSVALGDLLRKAVAAGLTGVFGPTEAVRRAVGDAMPRDWIDFAAAQSDRTRSELLERLAQEVARTLATIDLAQIAERVLDGRTIELRAQIRLAPREVESSAVRARNDGSKRAPFRFLVVDGDNDE